MALDIVIEAISTVAKALFGSRNERLVRAYGAQVDEINALEVEMQSLSDDGLLAVTAELRSRIRPQVDELVRHLDRAGNWDDPLVRQEYRERLGDILEPVLPQAFAAVREAAKRTVWLGYEEAPPDYHPEVQDTIRKAMRGEASLIDASSAGGRPIELYGLYGMRPYDVQLVAGMALNDGRISELATGEGKTLVATLAAYLNALTGRPVHIVSVNDYLVRRDCTWNRPIFRRLGLTVGAIQADMDNRQRQVEYACDVTYGTNNEFGFDYLRDNMKTSRAEQVQGQLAYAIVDECDSVLIDEARTPLIISGPAFESTEKYAKADGVARQLKPGRDFQVKEKEHQCPLTEEGVRRAEELVGVGSFYVAGNMEWPHLLDQALRAHHLYRLDKDYVVRGDEVIIVDEFTGRLMTGRQWSDGLHQAVEAKERIRIKEETQTLATITLQNFFRMYKKCAGMTGTAMTEAAEFDKIYRLETVSIPTNRPLSRIGHADIVFRSKREKFTALVEEIKRYHDLGRPVLVGTTSIENSELLSRMLDRAYGIPHEVLNAKFHEKEAAIVAKAGHRHVGPDGKEKGNVTVATNMAGRGTDIKLAPGVVWTNCFGPWDLARTAIPSDFGNKCCVGCPEYEPKTNCGHCFKPKIDAAFPERGRTSCISDPPCGLHVVGTERHESRRIDNQLRGRTGRQGDPGSSRFFLSLEDDLMRIFARDWVSGALQKLGMEEGMALEHRWLSRGIENAQKKVEERNFDIRKHLLEYDEVMDRQRKIFYGRRQRILESDDLRDFVLDMLTESVEVACDTYLTDAYSYDSVAEWARRTLNVQAEVDQLQGKDAGELADYLLDLARRSARDSIDETLGEFIPDGEAEAPEPEEDYGADEDEDEEPEEAGPPPTANYRALASWAEGWLGVRLRESDLRKLSVDQIKENLAAAADKRIEAVDLAPIAEYLRPDFRLASLADWAAKKFEFTAKPADMAGKNPDEVRRHFLDRLREKYAEKELAYPIEFAIEEHLVAQAGQSQQDFDGLAAWASRYYLTEVSARDIRHRDPRDVRRALLEIAREFTRSGRLRHTVEEGVAARMPAAGTGATGGSSAAEAGATGGLSASASAAEPGAAGDFDRDDSWQPLAMWCKDRLGIEITPQQFIEVYKAAPEAADEAGDGEAREAAAGAERAADEQSTASRAIDSGPEAGPGRAPPSGPGAVLHFVLARAEADHRSRMTELERFLLLQVHDTSWKDHLLVMDHLKSGVGLRGYAQLNPLIEFKKEGLESFEKMLASTREKFADLFFKARWVRQDALARIWAGQSSEHAVAASAYAAQQKAALEAHRQSQMAEEGETVKTIVRDKPKVGRNDPCPCGSGRKYKKCCGKRV